MTFEFSTTSWHYKLMKWIWNVDKESITNMCPYFWSVIATLLFIIPLTIYRVVENGMVKRKYNYLFRTIATLPSIEKIPPQTLLKLYKCFSGISSYWYTLLKKQYGEQYIKDLYSAGYLYRYKKENNNRFEEDFIDRTITNISNIYNRFFKNLVKPLLYIILGGVIVYVSPFISLYDVLLFFAIVLGICIFVGVSIFILYIVDDILKMPKKTSKFFSFIFTRISNACPGIKWKD